MRIEVDPDRCQGHGRCYALAPDLFGCDDEGFAIVQVPGPLDPSQADDARRAADNCPEYAISLPDDDEHAAAPPR